MTMSEFIELFGFIIALLPLILRLVVLVGQESHNKKLKNLSERSTIIVSALEKSGMTNEDKKQAALAKLSIYAKEVGIKVSPQQMEDYIESAVLFIKELQTSKIER